MKTGTRTWIFERVLKKEGEPNLETRLAQRNEAKLKLIAKLKKQAPQV